MKPSTGEKEAKKTIGVRFDDEIRNHLIQQAKEMNLDLSELVRRLVLTALREDEAKASHYEALCEFKNELLQIRRDIALSVEVLLSDAGKRDPEEALEWAKNNLSDTDLDASSSKP